MKIDQNRLNRLKSIWKNRWFHISNPFPILKKLHVLFVVIYFLWLSWSAERQYIKVQPDQRSSLNVARCMFIAIMGHTLASLCLKFLIDQKCSKIIDSWFKLQKYWRAQLSLPRANHGRRRCSPRLRKTSFMSHVITSFWHKSNSLHKIKSDAHTYKTMCACSKRISNKNFTRFINTFWLCL